MRSVPIGKGAPGGANLTDTVQQALAAAVVTRRQDGWSRTHVSSGLQAGAGLLGVYLAFFVLRMQELYPVLAVPRLPMVLSLVIFLMIAVSTPLVGWQTLFREVPAVRWQALLVALALVTAPMGIWMSGSINAAIYRYSLAVIVFIATALLLRDRKALTKTLTVLLASAIVTGFYTLSDSARTVGTSGRVRLGISLDPNDLAQLYVALIPLSLFMAQRRGGRNPLWLVGAGIMTMAVVPTQSRGGILGLGAVALCLISFGTTRWKKILYFVLVSAAAVGISMTAGSDSRMTDFSDYGGGEGRMAIWKRGLVWMSWRPWGYGLDNFGIFFDWMNGSERAAHNSFIQIGVELGLLGLLAFCAMWYTLARTLLSNRRIAVGLRGRAEGAELEALLATMTLAVLAGTVVTGFFLSKAYAPITLFTLGFATAVVLGFPFGEPQPIPNQDPARGPENTPRKARRHR